MSTNIGHIYIYWCSIKFNYVSVNVPTNLSWKIDQLVVVETIVLSLDLL